MGKLERTNAALPEKGCAFLSGLGRSRHMEDTLLFHLLLALCDGPIRTCPTGSQKVTSDWLSGECFFLGLFGAVRTFFPMVSNKCCWRKMIEHLTTRNAYQRKWTPSWHRPLQGFATNRNDSQGSYPPFIHAQLLQHVIMHLKLLTIALERSGQPDEAGGIARQGLGNDNECQHKTFPQKKSKEVNSWTHIYIYIRIIRSIIYIYINCLGPKLNTECRVLFVTSVPWRTNLLNIVFKFPRFHVTIDSEILYIITVTGETLPCSILYYNQFLRNSDSLARTSRWMEEVFGIHRKSWTKSWILCVLDIQSHENITE